MILKLFGLLIITTVIESESHGKVDKDVDYFAPAKYTFSYGVEDFKTGDYKMHKEERIGDVVKGEYSVADPDGSIRIVTYTADKEHGFQAVVKSDSMKLSPKLNESQETSAQFKKTESIDYKSSFDGLVQNDFKQQSNLNDYLHEKEINQHFAQYLKNNNKFQLNQPDHMKDNIIQKKKQQESNLVIGENLENKDIFKENQNNPNKGYVFPGFQVEYQQYKPEKYIGYQNVENPKHDVNEEAFKTDVNTKVDLVQNDYKPQYNSYYHEQEINQHFNQHLKNNNKFQLNQPDHMKNNIIQKKKQQESNLVIGKNLENKEILKVNAVQSNDVTKENQNNPNKGYVFPGFQVEYQQYKPEKYIGYQNVEIPKQDVNEEAFKTDVNTKVGLVQNDYKPQSNSNYHEQEINQHFDQHLKNNNNFQLNQPDHMKDNIIQKKKQQESNLVIGENLENQDILKVTAVQSNDVTKVKQDNQNKGYAFSGFQVEYQQYKPENYIGYQNFEIPKQDVNEGALKTDVNTKAKVQSQLYYAPLSVQDYKHIQHDQQGKLEILNGKQSNPELYYTQNQQNGKFHVFNEVRNDQPLFYYPSIENGKAHSESSLGKKNKPVLFAKDEQNEKLYVSNEMYNHQPAFSYQSILNGKSQDSLQNDHHFESSVGKKNAPELFTKDQQNEKVYVFNEKYNYQPAFFHQNVVNGKAQDNLQNDHHLESSVGKQNKQVLFTKDQQNEKVYVFNEMEKHQPAFSYQSIVNVKSQDNLQNNHHFESSIEKENKPVLFAKDEQNEKFYVSNEMYNHQPAFFYQSIVNGKSQDNLQYDHHSKSSNGKQNNPELFNQNLQKEKVDISNEKYQSIVNGKSQDSLQNDHHFESSVGKQIIPELFNQDQQNEKVYVFNKNYNYQPEFSH